MFWEQLLFSNRTRIAYRYRDEQGTEHVARASVPARSAEQRDVVLGGNGLAVVYHPARPESCRLVAAVRL